VSYNLYIFETILPIQQYTGKCSSKVGIAKILDSRNADYQQAVGPDYPFQFEATWAGDEKEIRWLERNVLKHFKVKRCSEIRALSEWIKDTRASELEKYIDEVIQTKKLNITKLD
jgi:hypothetical protein